jgi:hypothetical protein
MIHLFCDKPLERQPNDDDQLRVEAIRSPAELQELWAIDSAAYGEASITLETFMGWWRSYPSGLKVLFLQGRIVGALGIWPLSDRCARRLTDGRIKESEITGRMMCAWEQACSFPVCIWHCPGAENRWKQCDKSIVFSRHSFVVDQRKR